MRNLENSKRNEIRYSLFILQTVLTLQHPTSKPHTWFAMSRSALWRQEAGVKERELVAQDAFQTAVEEGRNVRTKGMVPLYGPTDSFHIHPMLLQCIVKAPYFVKCCNDLKDWNALVDEIYYEVKHVEPWAAAGKNEGYIDSISNFPLLPNARTL